MILNPLDERMPYWSPGDELRHEAEALTLAASLFPDRHNENPFFVEGPTKNLRALADLQADAGRAGLVDVPRGRDRPESERHGVRGDDRPAGAAAAERRAGVAEHGSRRLKLLPSETETKGRWSTLEWSKERKGWLFLTSTPETRKRLVPLTSLWLDTLVLRLMNQGQHESASGVVRSGRTGELAAVAAVAHGDHREPQVEQSGGAGFPGTQPA